MLKKGSFIRDMEGEKEIYPVKELARHFATVQKNWLEMKGFVRDPIAEATIRCLPITNLCHYTAKAVMNCVTN